MKKQLPAAEPTPYDIATLAARLVPVLCQQRPDEAIEVARKLIKTADEQLANDKELAEIMKQAEGHYFHQNFKVGVRMITGEKRADRNMPPFRRFLRSQVSEREADKLVATYRTDGFRGEEVALLRDAFAAWKAKDKSSKARASRSKRRK